MSMAGRNHIYESVIRNLVAQALEEQEACFCRIHEDATDQELLDYLRAQAEALGHTPRYMEIIGSKLIVQRFGQWNRAIAQAGLPEAKPCPVSQLPRIRQETQRQKECYRQRKAEKKQRSRTREQARKQRAESEKL